MAPPLPQIHGDLILDVFTHHSLTQGFLNDQTPQGNGERLALLGRSVLDITVTFLLFAEKPMLSAEDLKAEHAYILGDESVVAWVNCYDTELKKRMRVMSPDIFDDPKEARFLFNSYVGAVCVEHGLQAAADWISKLIKPDEQPLVLCNHFGNSPTVAPPSSAQAGTLQAAAPPPCYPNTSQVSTSPPGNPQGYLAMLNQTCSQLHITLEWNMNHMNVSGLHHGSGWEVKCMVNGVERGCGLGRNQKQAKEAAAKVVYQYMQNISWNVQQPEPTV